MHQRLVRPVAHSIKMREEETVRLIQNRAEEARRRARLRDEFLASSMTLEDILSVDSVSNRRQYMASFGCTDECGFFGM